jgi:hypothetical protein
MFDRGPRDRGDRGGREQRVYTVEPAREVVETRTHKGEFTSLANLRALLGGKSPAQAPAPAPKAAPPAPEPVAEPAPEPAPKAADGT